METQFSFSNLVPDFTALLNGTDYSSSESFSAIVISAIVVVAVTFLLLSVKSYVKAFRRINFLYGLLKGVSQKDLPSVHEDIKERAFEFKECGRLWKEFHESLVVSKGRINNTIDAQHFFNTHTLAQGLTESRLIAAVPGFLTAIGVIGTFAGLQMGLAPMTGLDINNAGAAKELLPGIYGMIGGAAVAFTTSVWGITFSVLFNFIEKLLERHIRSKISILQNRIDYLYPRITPEESLVKLAENSESNKETLDHLAEKIGDRMQEVMTVAAQNIADSVASSIDSSLKPAMEKFADVINEGPGDALESLITAHSENLRSSGDLQRDLMEKANQEIASTVEGMGQKFSTFLDGVNQAAENTKNQEAERNEQLERKIKEITSMGERETARLAGLVNTLMTKQEQIDESRQEEFSRVTSEMKDQQHNMVDRLKDVTGKMLELHSGLSELVSSNQEAVTGFKEVSSSMAGAASDIKQGGSEISEATKELGLHVNSAVNETKELAESNQLAANEIVLTAQALESTQTQALQLTSDLKTVAQHAENAFQSMDTHMREYQAGLKKHVNDIELEMEKVLSRYADLVQQGTENRLSAWNSETSNYISMMTDAVTAIQAVVNDIESTVGA